MKVCTKCKIEKEQMFFSKHKLCKDGHVGYCKDCEKQAKHEQYIKNKASVLAKTKQWSLLNPRKRRDISKNWYEANKEKTKERAKQWANNNVQKRKEIANKYAANNIEIKKQWEKDNHEKVKEYHRRRDKKEIKEISLTYLKRLLKAEFKTKEVIEQNPILLDLKKAEIIVYRSKKQITNKNKSIWHKTR